MRCLPVNKLLKLMPFAAVILLCGVINGQQPGGQGSDKMHTLGTELQRIGNEPLQIFYIHGIGAMGPGDSIELRKSICKHARKYMHAKCSKDEGEFKFREFADQEIFAKFPDPSKFTYMGDRIWKTAEEWSDSQPFVDHYEIDLSNGQKIFIHEINWWTMVFGIKCPHVMSNEAYLAGELTGKNNNYLKLCATQSPDPKDPHVHTGPYFNWMKAADLDWDKLNAMPKRAVIFNRSAKTGLMDWRFSDALLGVGDLEGYLVEGIRQLVAKSVAWGARNTTGFTPTIAQPYSPNADYIAISHSMGSYLLFSSLHAEYNPEGTKLTEERKALVYYLLGHLSQAYFFANQIPLLELAKLGRDDDEEKNISSRSTQRSVFLNLRTWGDARAQQCTDADKNNCIPRIVAWNDPNDLLTWYLGKDFQDWQGQGAMPNNVLVRNASSFLWIIVNPGKAHDNYAMNAKVIRSLLEEPKHRLQ